MLLEWVDRTLKQPPPRDVAARVRMRGVAFPGATATVGGQLPKKARAQKRSAAAPKPLLWTCAR